MGERQATETGAHANHLDGPWGSHGHPRYRIRHWIGFVPGGTFSRFSFIWGKTLVEGGRLGSHLDKRCGRMPGIQLLRKATNVLSSEIAHSP